MGQLGESIKRFRRVSIDTNLFVYLMERNRDYFDSVKELFNAVESGKVFAVSSVLLMTEVLSKPLMDGDKGLADRYMAFIGTFPNLELREVDRRIAFRAAKLRAKYGLKTPDALFVATAIEEKAEAFVTNDIRLRKVDEIEILVLDDFFDTL